MSLQKRCLNDVRPDDRERGATYFHQRRVSLGELHRHGVEATVEGSAEQAYEVRLDWTTAESAGTLTVSCSCPRFSDFVICKHVWATIVAYDRAQFTESVPGTGHLDLIRKAPAAASADPVDGHPAADPDQQAMMPRYEELVGIDPPPGGGRRRPGSAGAHPAGRRPEVSGWKDKLESIRGALHQASRAGGRRRQREVWYRLNVKRSLDEAQLVVDF